jgi:hypothetical protein
LIVEADRFPFAVTPLDGRSLDAARLTAETQEKALMYTFWYDAIYYGICLTMTLVLVVTLIRGVRFRRRSVDSQRRAHESGILTIAAGTAIAFVVGVGLNAIRSSTGDLFYQQSHFVAIYVGFGMITFGVIHVLGTAPSNESHGPARWTWPILRCLVWLAYAGATFVAGSALAHADEDIPGLLSRSTHVVQQVVFFLPVFVTLAIGAVTLLGLAAVRVDPQWRRRSLAGLGLFAAMAFVGFLREATIIPSSGEPFVDLFMAFGPFVLAVVFLSLGERFAELGPVAL